MYVTVIEIEDWSKERKKERKKERGREGVSKERKRLERCMRVRGSNN
jgi:hypothetical protein